MKYLKYILVAVLMFSFALVSCKKDSSTGPGGGSIEGSWTVVDAIVGWLLTTNSNQSAINMFDITGQIDISGTQTASMDFMVMDTSTDPPSFVISDVTANYLLIIDGTTGEGMLFANNQTFVGNVTFAYNNGTLTVSQSIITDVASTATVTISGSLSYNQANIPANTPTFVELTFDDDDPTEEIGLSTIEFNSDGTATVTTVDMFGTEVETWTYTTDGNQMTITDEEDDVVVFDYTVTGNTLTLKAIDFDDYCGEFNSQADCFEDTELFFNLTPGSLTAVSMQVEIILNKTTAKPGYAIRNDINIFNPAKIISNYQNKVEKLKQSI